MEKGLLRRIGRDLFWSVMPKSLEFEPYTTRIVARETNYIVRSGPFSGMKYIRKSYASVLSPKLLGIYERELHTTIERAISYPFHTVIDIGAAEGYYSTGFAMRMPGTQIVAYEMNETARGLMKELVSLNNVAGRVIIKGICTIDEMNAVLDPSHPTLVICDAEGAESYLLDPLRVLALKNLHILVELHDFIVGGLSQTIRSRFESTHDIEQIFAERRSRSEFPFKSMLTERFNCYASFAVSDCRPPGMSWYWMQPKPQA